MLGRLRMGVDDCKREYIRLMETIWDGPRTVHDRYDSTALRDAMNSLNGAAAEYFHEETGQRCRV